MILIVDTYNVLHVTGVLPPDLAGLEVSSLAALIAMSRYAAGQAWLVCDGAGRSGTTGAAGRIAARFAGPGRAADDEIERLIDLSSAPRRLTVVSSDLRLGRAARRRRCRWLRSEEFLAQLVSDVRRTRRRPGGPPARSTRIGAPLGRGEVLRWMEHFGLDPELLELAPAPAPVPVAASAQRERVRETSESSMASGQATRRDVASVRTAPRMTSPHKGINPSPDASPAPALSSSAAASGPAHTFARRPDRALLPPRERAAALAAMAGIDFAGVMREALEAIPENAGRGAGSEGSGRSGHVRRAGGRGKVGADDPSRRTSSSSAKRREGR